MIYCRLFNRKAINFILKIVELYRKLVELYRKRRFISKTTIKINNYDQIRPFSIKFELDSNSDQNLVVLERDFELDRRDD